MAGREDNVRCDECTTANVCGGGCVGEGGCVGVARGGGGVAADDAWVDWERRRGRAIVLRVVVWLLLPLSEIG